MLLKRYTIFLVILLCSSLSTSAQSYTTLSDISFSTTENQVVDLNNVTSSYEIVIIEFFSPTCHACNSTHPDLKTAYTSLTSSENFTMISLSLISDLDQVRDYKEDYPSDWDYGIINNIVEVREAYDVQYTPTFLGFYNQEYKGCMVGAPSEAQTYIDNFSAIASGTPLPDTLDSGKCDNDFSGGSNILLFGIIITVLLIPIMFREEFGKLLNKLRGKSE